MNRREYHWRDSMRLRAGLLWKSDTPSVADYPSVPRCVAMLLTVLVLWCWSMDRDYAEQMQAEAERHAEISDERTKALAECLNGTARFITADEKSGIACRKAEVFPL